MEQPEPVQKGNPHKLTFNQHTFPVRSIERYVQDGGVEVHEMGPNRTLRRRPKDVLFCARRVWDHNSEHGYMGEVEDAYQGVADKILDGSRLLTAHQHSSITDYYLLWNLRQRERSNAPTYPQFPAWKPETVATEKDEQEQLEKKGVLYRDQNDKIPNRLLAGTSLQLQMWAERERMRDTEWGIFEVKPDQGEFLVSDRFSQHSVVPLSPEICLVADHPNQLVDFSFVGRINGLAVENAEDYYFARNIEKCPILLRATIRDELTRAGLLRWALRYAQ